MSARVEAPVAEGQARSVIITGASSGLGLACAVLLAARRWHVVLACRDRERGEAARRFVDRQTASPGGVEVAELDVSRLTSVRAFVEQLGRARRPRLCALVCNAGVQASGKATWTPEGIETTFATNHLGHFLLSRLLLDELAGGQIVLVSSNTHDPKRWTGMPAPRLDDVRAVALGRVQLENDKRSGRTRYTTSKLCNVLCAYELDRRLRARDGEATRLAVNAFDPGLMPGTGLAREYGALARAAWRYLLPFFTLFAPNVNRVQTSARRLVDLIEIASREHVTGKYFSRGRFTRSSAESYDPELARALWDVSSEMSGLPSSLELSPGQGRVS
jgi:light-dependent protochlorophyllide reductase